MTDHLFGVYKGRLSKREQAKREVIAQKYGISWVRVAGNNGNCACGHGCRLDKCPVGTSWFSTPAPAPELEQKVLTDVLKGT